MKEKRLAKLVERARANAGGYRLVVGFPDLEVRSEAAPLSNNIGCPIGKRDLLTDHLWRKDAADSEAAIAAALEKRKRIGPSGHKQGDAYLGADFVPIVQGAVRRT